MFVPPFIYLYKRLLRLYNRVITNLRNHGVFQAPAQSHVTLPVSDDRYLNNNALTSILPETYAGLSNINVVFVNSQSIFTFSA